jgi:hypothetical protein
MADQHISTPQIKLITSKDVWWGVKCGHIIVRDLSMDVNKNREGTHFYFNTTNWSVFEAHFQEVVNITGYRYLPKYINENGGKLSSVYIERFETVQREFVENWTHLNAKAMQTKKVKNRVDEERQMREVQQRLALLHERSVFIENQNYKKQQQIAEEQRVAGENEIRLRVKQRDIKYLRHFTRLENLKGILDRGLLPRRGNESIEMHFTDPDRFDERMDCVSLSIMFPNDLMFYRKRARDFPNSVWCVITISPEILWSNPCLFFPDNAAIFKNTNRADYRTPEAFDELFNKENRPKILSDCLPTNVQAEVQSEKPIPLEMISGIYFENDSTLSKFNALSIPCPNHIEVSCKSLFFNTRDRALNN